LNYGLVCCVLLIVASCGITNKSVSRHASTAKTRKNQATLLEVDRVEAQLVDIPLPIRTVVEVQHVSFSATDATAIMVQSQVKLNAQELLLFYQREMERNGWRQIFSFEGPESILIFDRHSRSCIITIRVTKQLSALMIVTGTKID